MKEVKREFSELENKIIDTLLELGAKFCSESELELRASWYEDGGDYLTSIERFDLRIARGEKLTPYEKQNRRKAIQQLKAAQRMTKSIEKKWSDEGLVWCYEKSKLVKKDNKAI